MNLEQLVDHVRHHRAYTHTIFHSWVKAKPRPDVVGALFHHIQSLCACSRPAWNFEVALTALDRPNECKIFKNIVKSEEDHGPQLATMAALIVNRAAHEPVFPDLHEQTQVERGLQAFSSRFFGSLPGYDRATGSLPQDRRVRAVFDRRKEVDRDSTYRNIGALLAIEMLANGQIIPGEQHCLVESGLYGLAMDDVGMEYLREHAGDDGAEQWHEQQATQAVGAMLDAGSAALIFDGTRECLDAVCGLWDLLEATLLQPASA
jgi:hypothetical protein